MDELDELAGVLAKEASLLEVLVFRLVELRHLLVAGEGRFLSWAAEDVTRSTRAVRDLELQRALVVAGLASRRSLPQEAVTLAYLAETAAPPWSAILDEHRATLTALVGEVEGHVSAIRRLARAGADTVAAALDELFPDPPRPHDRPEASP